VKNILASILVLLMLNSPGAFALPGSQVNVNTATATQLAETLVGVGAARAQAIVEYRQQHGDYASVTDLLGVRGIGDHVIETNRDKIAFED